MIFEEMTGKINKDPRMLFLIDGLGAMLSALLLGIVLVKLEKLFGIPKTTLYLLAVIPCAFAVYDLCCYCIKNIDMPRCLKGIAYMNILYCCLSIVLALYHFQKIKFFGWLYITLEIIIIIALAIYELKVSVKLEDSRN